MQFRGRAGYLPYHRHLSVCNIFPPLFLIKFHLELFISSDSFLLIKSIISSNIALFILIFKSRNPKIVSPWLYHQYNINFGHSPMDISYTWIKTLWIYWDLLLSKHVQVWAVNNWQFNSCSVVLQNLNSSQHSQYWIFCSITNLYPFFLHSRTYIHKILLSTHLIQISFIGFWQGGDHRTKSDSCSETWWFLANGLSLSCPVYSLNHFYYISITIILKLIATNCTYVLVKYGIKTRKYAIILL